MTAARTMGLATDTPWLGERCGGWKRARLLTRCGLFILGLVVAALAAGLLSLLHVSAALFWGGLAAIAVAEWLVIKRRFFGTGLEEALEISGLLMIAYQALNHWNISHDAAVASLFAVIFAAAGLRLRNPLFTTASVVACSAAVGAMISPDLGARFSSNGVASVFCFAVTAIALFAAQHSFRRPADDRMLGWLIASMPLPAYLWLKAGHSFTSLDLEPHGFGSVHWFAALALLLIGLSDFGIGIRRRSHSCLIGFMACTACLAYELRNLMGLSLKARLMLWGGVTLLVAVGLDRYLRKPWRGVTSVPVTEGSQALELLEMVSVNVLAPASPAPPRPGFEGGGGKFGGGGASDRW